MKIKDKFTHNNKGDILEDSLAMMAADIPLEQILVKAGEEAEWLKPLLELAVNVGELQQTFTIPPPEASLQRMLSYRNEITAAAQPIAPARSIWQILFGHNQGLKLATGLITALLAVILLGTVTVQAAQGSLPGQSLYSLKQAGENLRLSLTWEPQQREHLMAVFNQNRKVETQLLLEQGLQAPVAFEGTVESLTTTALTIDDIVTWITPETTITGQLAVKAVVRLDGVTQPPDGLLALVITVVEPAPPATAPNDSNESESLPEPDNQATEEILSPADRDEDPDNSLLPVESDEDIDNTLDVDDSNDVENSLFDNGENDQLENGADTPSQSDGENHDNTDPENGQNDRDDTDEHGGSGDTDNDDAAPDGGEDSPETDSDEEDGDNSDPDLGDDSSESNDDDDSGADDNSAGGDDIPDPGDGGNNSDDSSDTGGDDDVDSDPGSDDDDSDLGDDDDDDFDPGDDDDDFDPGDDDDDFDPGDDDDDFDPGGDDDDFDPGDDDDDSDTGGGDDDSDEDDSEEDDDSDEDDSEEDDDSDEDDGEEDDD